MLSIFLSHELLELVSSIREQIFHELSLFDTIKQHFFIGAAQKC